MRQAESRFAREDAQRRGAKMSVTIRSSQKVFTEEEISGLTGISLENLRSMARTKHLGFLARAAEAGGQAGSWLYTNSDLFVVAVLCQRFRH
jgi:hypothetical protein